MLNLSFLLTLVLRSSNQLALFVSQPGILRLSGTLSNGRHCGADLRKYTQERIVDVASFSEHADVGIHALTISQRCRLIRSRLIVIMLSAGDERLGISSLQGDVRNLLRYLRFGSG